MIREEQYDIMRDMFEPCLLEMDMVEDEFPVDVPERAGRVFRMPASVATGYFWMYTEYNFAVSVTDMRFFEDYRECCPHPRFISARYYHSGHYIERNSGREVEGPYLEGHVLDIAQWDCLCKAGEPLRNVDITLAPPFYEQHLRSVYRDELFSGEEAFASIDGLTDFPELVVLLKQLEAYRGHGASARLFYRSKVEEAVALIVGKSQSLGTVAPELGSDDMHAIEHVRHLLEANLDASLSADELARVACMGQTKLRRLFKQTCGCTMVEYRQRARCSRAAELLVSGTIPVAQVARVVGYSPERLAELFARHYGCAPSVFRSNLRL